MLIQIAEIVPISDNGREECPFNCIDCPYNGGVIGDEIECLLPDE